MPEDFPLKSATIKWCLRVLLLFYIVLEILASTLRLRMINTRYNRLQAIYWACRIPSPKDKLLEFIRTFSKIARSRINTPKSMAFPNTSHELLANKFFNVFYNSIKNKVSRNKSIKRYARPLCWLKATKD